MAAVFAKVFLLAIKTAAKPVSSRFQAYVMNHPVARQRAINAAQFLHRMEVVITRGAEGRTGKAFIADMTEEKSIELASKLVSEGFVFAVGIGIVVLEYQRQAVKDAKKREAERRERMALQLNAERERQRLAAENLQQQELIQHLLLRLDKLEGNLHELEAVAVAAAEAQKRKPRSGLWGGFFGPTGLDKQANKQNPSTQPQAAPQPAANAAAMPSSHAAAAVAATVAAAAAAGH